MIDISKELKEKIFLIGITRNDYFLAGKAIVETDLDIVDFKNGTVTYTRLKKGVWSKLRIIYLDNTTPIYYYEK